MSAGARLCKETPLPAPPPNLPIQYYPVRRLGGGAGRGRENALFRAFSKDSLSDPISDLPFFNA